MSKSTRRTLLLASAALALPALASMSGCWVPLAVGGMVESYKESSTREVPADYLGLQGKSFAVVVAADRAIQAQFPGIVPQLVARVSERLRAESGASGYVPPGIMINYMNQKPRWVALTYSELAEELGVERLVFIDLTEFRLNEPGNQFVWEGIAAATVGVAEMESFAPDEFSYRRELRVDFPDGKGFTSNDFGGDVVQSRLLNRITDRITWLFYNHQEPYYPDY
ncbi:MAG: hypothetical protein ACTS27_03250 [Phycisphaerales bacterium]